MNSRRNMSLFIVLPVLCLFLGTARASELVVTGLEPKNSSGDFFGPSYEVTLNGLFRICDVSILRVSNSSLLKMPSYLSRAGKDYPVVVITNREALEDIKDSILKGRVSRSFKARSVQFDVRDVKRFYDKGELKAFVWVSFYDTLSVQLSIFESDGRSRVSWPGYNENGAWKEQVVLLDNKTKNEVESAVMKRFISKRRQNRQEESEE